MRRRRCMKELELELPPPCAAAATAEGQTREQGGAGGAEGREGTGHLPWGSATTGTKEGDCWGRGGVWGWGWGLYG
jgi:hypothetical protein